MYFTDTAFYKRILARIHSCFDHFIYAASGRIHCPRLRRQPRSRNAHLPHAQRRLHLQRQPPADVPRDGAPWRRPRPGVRRVGRPLQPQLVGKSRRRADVQHSRRQELRLRTFPVFNVFFVDVGTRMCCMHEIKY